MNRYSIEMTALEWGVIGIDLAHMKSSALSTQRLEEFIKLIINDVTAQDSDLPFNIKEIV